MSLLNLANRQLKKSIKRRGVFVGYGKTFTMVMARNKAISIVILNHPMRLFALIVYERHGKVQALETSSTKQVPRWEEGDRDPFQIQTR
jgi:hypothetical protein